MDSSDRNNPLAKAGKNLLGGALSAAGAQVVSQVGASDKMAKETANLGSKLATQAINSGVTDRILKEAPKIASQALQSGCQLPSQVTAPNGRVPTEAIDQLGAQLASQVLASPVVQKEVSGLIEKTVKEEAGKKALEMIGKAEGLKKKIETEAKNGVNKLTENGMKLKDKVMSEGQAVVDTLGSKAKALDEKLEVMKAKLEDNVEDSEAKDP